MPDTPVGENVAEAELWSHLENNYNYAKKVEGAIDLTRTKVAAEILLAQA